MNISGWKTKYGAIGLILTGVATCVSAVTFEPFSVDGEQFTAGVTMIAGAITALGIGHKIEKGPQ